MSGVLTVTSFVGPRIIKIFVTFNDKAFTSKVLAVLGTRGEFRPNIEFYIN